MLIENDFSICSTCLEINRQKCTCPCHLQNEFSIAEQNCYCDCWEEEEEESDMEYIYG
jgi:hypothetical protein